MLRSYQNDHQNDHRNERRTRRILHIEDNAGDRALFQMAAAATAFDLEITTAASATEAIHLLNGCQTGGTGWPDLLVLDLGLNDIPGQFVLDYLRRLLPTHTLPVVVLTASLHDSDRIACEAHGVLAYYHKPNDFRNLVCVVHAVVDLIDHPPRRPAREQRSSGSHSSDLYVLDGPGMLHQRPH
jgi:CheY-like chemotaxis protein